LRGDDARLEIQRARDEVAVFVRREAEAAQELDELDMRARRGVR